MDFIMSSRISIMEKSHKLSKYLPSYHWVIKWRLYMKNILFMKLDLRISHIGTDLKPMKTRKFDITGRCDGNLLVVYRGSVESTKMTSNVENVPNAMTSSWKTRTLRFWKWYIKGKFRYSKYLHCTEMNPAITLFLYLCAARFHVSYRFFVWLFKLITGTELYAQCWSDQVRICP